MGAFKEENLIVIAPGSAATLAVAGLAESLAPAKLRVKSRMFPAENGEWEPFKVRRKTADNGQSEQEPTYEEDVISEEGAVWPMVEGRIVNWPCFFALITHVYNTLNPPFHTPILLVAQPAWTNRDIERITQFFFEKFKIPAFALVDSATAACWAYGTNTATIVDIGWQKADVTVIYDYAVQSAGRAAKAKGFTREMCEQLKRSPICEVLPPGTPLPGSSAPDQEPITNPAAAASTGASGSGPAAAAAIGNGPRGPGPDTEVGEEQKDEEDNEGVLDVASIVAGGKMNEYLAKKEKEKAERLAAKKKGGCRSDSSKANHALLDSLKNMNLSGKMMADAQAALDEGPNKRQKTPDATTDGDHSAANGEPSSAIEPNGVSGHSAPRTGPIRREIEVGVERFQAATGGVLDRIADAIHRTISAEMVQQRSQLWDSLVVVGNGAKLRGFKEALMSTLQSKYLISPSSATIFTSELPSHMTTPTGTGANTPQPQLGLHGGGSSSVNPLLLAATTAQTQHLAPPHMPSSQMQHTQSSHQQTPHSIKFAKVPDYFPEWKDVGYDEAGFLGAQVAAKVLFVVDTNQNQKGYMTRSDYNEQGPSGIHDFSL
ncbi:Actin-like protein arp9 (SWI/SNF complex component arp9) [Coniosporium tulheliwenetii]|uniref:Actin-like protein arp9 (SWI/SNF complex component arp9) n=1 Tax=Coniosporium tulheliwenetii TaxID=3383036 RepID=A0ACC2ZPS6_9PEZI|nr:Actin-like protein arp9 (SWI/SNF complex component arp9) [Cladosporium sp. JES 115]